ncbi:endonuclease/exonuclease/phosphatase family protein [Pyxidicoccus sp. MSG2]|uniref:endonuclease/exonuclease/phosphatase family protein n=1 Tax=Pyxidicoccus sp. MSG2 TaxID=2996790 RepID=UPI00226DCB70|nr:endonuclease/exonuclease/phosphatase family protein [Pyxidicoccus sp. MSG2]MCY1023212.1 endonuclease/exonuclease/phosphatase family protein [Pyxidicoccus sp. MSG2]
MNSHTRHFTRLLPLLLVLGTASLAWADTPVRIVTWNVHPRSIAGETPEGRMNRLLTFAAGQGVDIIAFQEVPRSLLNTPARLDPLMAAATQAGFEVAALPGEYPNTPGRTPTSNIHNAYMVLYNPNVVTPANVAPGTDPAMTFFRPELFTQGPLNQARPPATLTFDVRHADGGTSPLHLLTWHNEAGSLAAGHVRQLEGAIQNHLATQQGNWVVVGDFNVADSTAEMQDLDADYHLLTHDENGIDHILSNATITNVVNDDAAHPIDPRFRSDGRHLALFGELNIPRGSQ